MKQTEVYRFSNGFDAQAMQMYQDLRNASLSPSWGKNGSVVIMLPNSQVSCLRLMQRHFPARWGNLPDMPVGMVLNRTRKHQDRYQIVPGSMGNSADPKHWPTHRYEIVSGIDRGNGFQGYTNLTYFLTECPGVPAEAKRACRKFLENRGYADYLQEIDEKKTQSPGV